MSILLAFLSLFSFQQDPVKSIPGDIASKPDSIQAKLYLAATRNSSLSPKTVDSLAELAFAKAKSAGLPAYQATAAALISNFNAETDLRKGQAWADTSIYYYYRSNDFKGAGIANLNIGYYLNRAYQFERGIRYIHQSIQDFEKAGDSTLLVQSYTHISNAFHDFGNYEQGKKYGKLAIALTQKMKDPSQEILWRSFCVLAINYDDNGEWTEALALHQKNIPNAYNDIFRFSTYNNMGNTSMKMKNYPAAQEYFQTALALAIKLKDNYHSATIYTNLSRVNAELKNIRPSLTLLDSGMYYARQSKSPEKLIDAYENGYIVHTKAGNIEKATAYMQQYIKMKDSVLNADKARIVYDLQIQYETEKKERENEKLQHEMELKTVAQQEAEADKRMILYIAAGCIIALGFIFLLVSRNRKIKARFAEEQNINKALFDGEQKERIRIARDLHDSIGQMLAVVKMQVSTIGTTAPESQTITNISSLVDKTIDEVRAISHNLIPEELNFGIIKAIDELCNKINAAGKTQASFTVAHSVASHSFNKQTELSLYRITQEVLGNMLKHAEASEIMIELSGTATKVMLTIRDNGKGFDTASLDQASGLGWKNVLARVHLLNGNMNIHSERISGTQIEITIPG